MLLPKDLGGGGDLFLVARILSRQPRDSGIVGSRK
jgi:hypothetical protein